MVICKIMNNIKVIQTNFTHFRLASFSNITPCSVEAMTPGNANAKQRGKMGGIKKYGLMSGVLPKRAVSLTVAH
jgi:hypothetical protein